MASPAPSPTSPTGSNVTATVNAESKSCPQSSINELQEVFSSILLARKEKNDYDPYQLPIDPKQVVYKWTGAFELSSFPRELRDRIYYHYLAPHFVRYRRKSVRTFPFDQPTKVANLFLTSKQVYVEAYEVFCRYSTIHFPPFHGNKNVEGTLRLFPDRPASMLQRVGVTYPRPRPSWMYSFRPTHRINPTPSDLWLSQLMDAQTFRHYLPRLREFKACWTIEPEDFKAHGMRFDDDKTKEEKIEMWLTWMRRACKQSGNLVLPRWIKFSINMDYNYRCILQSHEDAINEAYWRLWQESTSIREAQQELEDSGKRWIEETSVKKSRKQRREERHLRGQCVEIC